jgi:hypothetical protein
VEAPVYKVVFDNSNALLIEKSVNGLEIVDKIRTAVSKTEKIAVASIERPYTVDVPINYLIEDQLIANLTTAGYHVLERDADMIPRFVSEGGTKYNVVDLSLPEKSVEGDSEVVIPNQANTETQIEPADIILSYRILECGILYNEVSEGTVTMGSQRSVERLARTRLHIRVTDAKTSEIKLATILENEIKDTTIEPD